MPANWFIALPIAKGPWFEALDPPAGVRLFGPSDLHLTVAFLGPVSEEQARLAFEHAQAFPLSAIDVRLGRVECLGSKRSPSAFSALLVDAEHRIRVEAAMAMSRDAMWNAAGARHDTRPALAHVTLARPTRRASTNEVEHALRWASEIDLGEPSVRLDRIALYTWSDDRKTSLFRNVASRALRSEA